VVAALMIVSSGANVQPSWGLSNVREQFHCAGFAVLA